MPDRNDFICNCKMSDRPTHGALWQLASKYYHHPMCEVRLSRIATSISYTREWLSKIKDIIDRVNQLYVLRDKPKLVKGPTLRKQMNRYTKNMHIKENGRKKR
jgi:hypothetical protein